LSEGALDLGRAGNETMLTFSRLVPLPENQAALVAVQGVAARLGARRPAGPHNPLFLHGPPGTGKTHLTSAALHEATRQAPDLAASVLSANDLSVMDEAAASLAAARDADLLVLEDLQHLPVWSAEPVVQLLDLLAARQQQMLFTATVGPGQLDLPARLTSRLASGLVVGLESFSAASRLILLRDGVQRRQLAVNADVLVWLADHLAGGGRQLEGALNGLAALGRLQARPLDVKTVAAHFQDQANALRPTVERITQRVGSLFQVDPRQLQSRRRFRKALLPRQVSMYLARQLTGLSLEEIGTYFGGRDHSTVLHACRKVEQVLAQDMVLSGTVRQLHADLA
jgi:chromosomal replication initiator protein